ncbi:MAG: alpha/beta hydrolase-fold protein, partial [Deltaproteobacteria bacterium]|nr:alpha/beta hydrolase-fold protein [Deltaproteobacteria bacterium]
MQLLSTHKCFGGQLGYYKHAASSTACDMRFTVFVPPGASANNKRRAVMFLSGLTCTEENFTTKAGAYRVAAELGLVIIAPDTSPRGASVPAGEGGEVGFGAGFYVNATNDPWAAHYRMESYIADELVNLILAEFPIASIGLCGHSMGGHGALTLFQKHPGKFRSLSAFAPICAASQSSWSNKA